MANKWSRDGSWWAAVAGAAAGPRWRVIVVGILIVQGCSFTGVGLACTDQFVYAVTVEVSDSLTGGLLSSTPTGILTDGQYRETMRLSPNQILRGGGERPGTYDVAVRAEGYQAWRMQGVEVQHDGYHVESVWLLARMVAWTQP